ncbi:MAG: hypothetical protein D6706_02915 [Chloroflexi bacterium]|nr:MAG: hypothetical protein D6706_02915 [Chloroflexota bacterium]
MTKKQTTTNSPAQEKKQPTSNDIEQLRDILFGHHARAIENRLDHLEKRLDTTRREWNEMLETRINKLAESSNSQLATTRQEFAEQLQALQKEITSSIEKLATEFQNQLASTRQEFTDKIDRLADELTERLSAAQSESRQRDDDLRQELLTLSAWLDNKKASRETLADLLIEMGRKLQDDITPSSETE